MAIDVLHAVHATAEALPSVMPVLSAAKPDEIVHSGFESIVSGLKPLHQEIDEMAMMELEVELGLLLEDTRQFHLKQFNSRQSRNASLALFDAIDDLRNDVVERQEKILGGEKTKDPIGFYQNVSTRLAAIHSATQECLARPEEYHNRKLNALLADILKQTHAGRKDTVAHSVAAKLEDIKKVYKKEKPQPAPAALGAGFVAVPIRTPKKNSGASPFKSMKDRLVSFFTTKHAQAQDKLRMVWAGVGLKRYFVVASMFLAAVFVAPVFMQNHDAQAKSADKASDPAVVKKTTAKVAEGPAVLLAAPQAKADVKAPVAETAKPVINVVTNIRAAQKLMDSIHKMNPKTSLHKMEQVNNAAFELLAPALDNPVAMRAMQQNASNTNWFEKIELHRAKL